MSLKDKASKLDFSTLPALGGTPKPGDQPGRPPKTAPGAMMAFANDARSDLLRENDELKARVAQGEETKSKLADALNDLKQWDGAKATRHVDASLVDFSRYANRHELSFTGPEYEQLKREIAEAGGNVVPVKVRVTRLGRFEAIFGHRRTRACQELGVPLLVFIDNVDDRTLFLEMDRENRSRKDLTAWEQGVMYKRALDDGLFPSNRRLAEALGVDLSNVGKAIALASLHDEIVNAFPSPLELQFRWAKPLKDAWDANAGTVRRRIAALQKEPAPSAKAVFESLVAPGEKKGVVPYHPPKTLDVKVAGKVAAKIGFTVRGATTVAIEAGQLGPDRLPELAALLERFLSVSKAQQ